MKCIEPCEYKCDCANSKCNKKCYEECDRVACEKACKRKLKCGHECIGFCGETCPKDCRVIGCSNYNPDTFTVFFGEEDSPDSKFVLLQDCNHSIESSALT